MFLHGKFCFIFIVLIHFSIYIVTSKGFSQFCNSHAYSIPLAYAGSMLYAIPNLLDIYTIDTHSIHFSFEASSPFQVCSSSAVSLCNTIVLLIVLYLFVIYSSNLVLLLVSLLLLFNLFYCFFMFANIFRISLERISQKSKS